MSEYQYYEFCRLHQPLSAEARKEMAALSSRAKVGTHNAIYVYNYGDFRGKPLALLLKHFDVFFYISNFGTIQLIFKYLRKEVDLSAIENHCVEQVIDCDEEGQWVWLDISITNEETSFDWLEGEEYLADFLPIYDEIKNGNYQFLEAVKLFKEGESDALSSLNLSAAQKIFLDVCVGN